MTTSPDVFICGLRGNGKSFAAKVMALREIEAGRHVIVQSDREGEWGRVANHVGGQVVSPGGGHYLNPFALPDRPSAGEDDLWRQEVLSGRKAAFMSLAEALPVPAGSRHAGGRGPCGGVVRHWADDVGGGGGPSRGPFVGGWGVALDDGFRA